MWSACYSLRVPKTKEDLIKIVAWHIPAHETEETPEEIAEEILDIILRELNITLAPIIGEAT